MTKAERELLLEVAYYIENAGNSAPDFSDEARRELGRLADIVKSESPD